MLLFKLFSILPKKQKQIFITLLFVILVNALFELIGVALLSPVVNILQGASLPNDAFKELVYDNIFSKAICDVFGVDPITSNLPTIVTIMLVIIIAVYIVKSIVFIFVTYLNARYVYSLQKYVSKKLMKSYLSMPYSYFTNTNSSLIIRKCTNDVDGYVICVKGVLTGAVAIFTAVAIFVYLMIVSWEATLFIALIMFVVCISTNFLIKRRAKKYGRIVVNCVGKKINILQQTIFGIKETKIANTEQFFVDRFNDAINTKAKYHIKTDVLNACPFLIAQNFGMILMICVLIALIWMLKPSEMPYIITLLTAIVVSVVKLLPAVTVISSKSVEFAFNKASIDAIANDLKEAEEFAKHIANTNGEKKEKKFIASPFSKTIEIKNLSFKYEDGIENVFSDVNIKIKKGEYVAISGDSGAGKTTLIDCILGLLVPQKGEILCDKKPIYKNIRGWHRLISYVPQTIYLLDDSIKANICFGLNSDEATDDKVWEALEKAKLKNYVESLPNKLNTRIGEGGVKFSGGQRQRIGIARAFFRDGPIIVLDEATSALDYKTEDAILSDIKKNKGNKTILIITHRLNTISNCDKIYRIENHVCRKIK